MIIDKLYDFMLDFNKQVLNVKLIYGVGGRWQKVNSTANFSDQGTGYFRSSVSREIKFFEEIVIGTVASSAHNTHTT